MCIYVKHLPDIFAQYISQMYFQDNSNRIVQVESLVRGVEESVGDSRAGVEEELREVGHHQGGDDHHQDGDDDDQTDNYIHCNYHFTTIVTIVFIIVTIALICRSIASLFQVERSIRELEGGLMTIVLMMMMTIYGDNDFDDDDNNIW